MCLQKSTVEALTESGYNRAISHGIQRLFSKHNSAFFKYCFAGHFLPCSKEISWEYEVEHTGGGGSHMSQASLANPLTKLRSHQGQLTRAHPTSRTANKTMTDSTGW